MNPLDHPWRNPSKSLGRVEVRPCRVCGKLRPVRSYPNNGKVKTCTDCSKIKKPFKNTFRIKE